MVLGAADFDDVCSAAGIEVVGGAWGAETDSRAAAVAAGWRGDYDMRRLRKALCLLVSNGRAASMER